MERSTVLYNSDRFTMEGQGRSTVQWALHPFECPLFETYGILSLGYSRTGAGYRILRRNPEFSNIHVTMSGRGEALIGGRWQVISQGMAILSPRGVLHGTRAIQRTPWEFCWICFSESEREPRKVSVREPTVVPIDPKPLTWAILSLYKETQQSRQPPVLDALVQLVHWYTQRICSPRNAPPVLWKLWEDIIQTPGQEWTVETMAERMNVSPRHLLRLCKRELGRSPHEQLASIRLTRASSLLQTSDLTLQAIAETVGYGDAFSLSKAFKSWSGLSPKKYRDALGRDQLPNHTAPSFQ